MVYMIAAVKSPEVESVTRTVLDFAWDCEYIRRAVAAGGALVFDFGEPMRRLKVLSQRLGGRAVKALPARPGDLSWSLVHRNVTEDD